MCMCICICVCHYTCVCMYVHVYTYVYACIYVYASNFCLPSHSDIHKEPKNTISILVLKSLETLQIFNRLLFCIYLIVCFVFSIKWTLLYYNFGQSCIYFPRNSKILIYKLKFCQTRKWNVLNFKNNMYWPWPSG